MKIKPLYRLFAIIIVFCCWLSTAVAQDENVTVTISNLPTTVQNAAFTVTITFSENVTGFATEDISLTGTATATVTDLTQGTDASIYTATITPTSDGTVIIAVDANAVMATDDADKNNSASDSHTVTVDVPPTVEITDVPTTVQNGAFTVKITFSETVSNFVATDITLGGTATATVTDLTKDTNVDTETYIATTTPTSDGTVTIKVPENVAQDTGNNDNTASAEETVTVDVPPTVVISNVSDIEKNEPFDITITFSEPVNGFQADDITLTGPATASIKTGTDGDSEYTATLTPNTDSEDDVKIKVPVGAAQDNGLNNNTASDEHIVHIDTIPPTVAITDIPDIEKNEPFDITITFSEPVNDFQADDIEITGPATISLTSGADGDEEYTATLTPNDDAEGEVTFKVPADTAQDFALNNNSESDEHTVHIDTIPPTVAITDIPDIEKNVPFDITITFSEPVNGFQVDDIELTGPATISLTSESNGDEEYTATITPNDNAEGEVTFKVPADTAQDFALNNNSESDEHTVHIDTIPPTVAITDVPDIEKNEPFDITITFSEPVNDFQVDSILIGPATASIKTGVDGDDAYTVTITPNTDAEDDVIIQVPVGAAEDFAFNNNTESDEHTVHIDTIPPTVAITNVPNIEKNEPFDITITFSEPINGFQIDDIELTGSATITLTSGSDGDSIYEATITPDEHAEEDVEFYVRADTAQDFALNDNTESTEHTVHVDTILPTVEIIDVPIEIQLEAFSVSIIFSEIVNDFEVDGIEITGDAVVDEAILSGGGSEYILTIIPNENTDGDLIIIVPEDIARDEATNANTESLPQSVFVAPKWIPDPNIRIAVREGLGLDMGEDFAREQLEDLTELDGFYRDITDITGLEYAANLISLELTGNSINDLTPLATLTTLTILMLSDNYISDITPLEDLMELTTLNLAANTIDDITALEGLTELTTLDLSENLISDLNPLAGLAALTHLYLTSNDIRDVSALANLKNLEVLHIKENPIQDTRPLVGLAKVIEADVEIIEEDVEVTEEDVEVTEEDTMVPPVLIPDPALAAVLRSTLDLDASTPITSTLLERLTTFQAASREITNVTGLEHATALTTLELSDNAIIDITPLQNLTELNTLNLGSNAITSITPLQDLTELNTLNLSNNPIGNLNPIQELTKLTTLELNGNAISNLNVLSKMTTLTVLSLGDNVITDITSLQNLTQLSTLNLSANTISDLNVLSELTGLTTLNLSTNAISNLIALAELKQLKVLNLNSNTVSNLTPLAGLTGLTTLILGNNAITSVAPITTLTQLKVLNLNNNSINDIRPLTPLTQLTTLNLTANNISDVAFLAGLLNLTTLRLAGNPILDTTALYPLTQRVPPVDIDIAVSQFPPWDVNADSSVNILDLVLVAAALGQSGDDIVNLRTDVNKDGSINILDLVLVAQHFGNNTADAPPSAELLTRLNPMTLASLDAATLETHLKILLAESDGSLKYQRVIAFLQTLLAAIPPHKTRLLANYPNPFNPETWIPYALAKGSDVHILIYDTRGAVVRHLELGHQSAGYYTEKNRAAYWDGRNTLGERVASGIYFFQLRAVNVSLLRKMVILK